MEANTVLAPALLVADETSARQRIALIEAMHPEVMQADVLDGTRYNATAWFDATALAPVSQTVTIEVDLMVQDPLSYLIRIHEANWKQWRAIWHVEALTKDQHLACIQWCHERSISCGLSLDPETDLHALEPYVARIHRALVLGVTPGASGQAMLDGMIERAQQLRALYPHLAIGFDGGVREEHLAPLIQAGVRTVCASSMIFNADDPVATYKALCDKLHP